MREGDRERESNRDGESQPDDEIQKCTVSANEATGKAGKGGGVEKVTERRCKKER